MEEHKNNKTSRSFRWEFFHILPLSKRTLTDCFSFNLPKKNLTHIFSEGRKKLKRREDINRLTVR
jgi:hypothetical protein